MLGAATSGHLAFQPVIESINELAETCAKEPWAVAPPLADKPAVAAELKELIGPQIEAAYRTLGKQDRSNLLDAAKAATATRFAGDDARQSLALKLFKDIEKDIVRGAILRDGQRIDGRDTKTVRPIESQVG